MKGNLNVFVVSAFVLFIVAIWLALYSTNTPVGNYGIASIGFAIAGGLSLVAAAIDGSRDNRRGV
jgi:hypothetical protein